MSTEIHLSRVESEFEDYSFPATRSELAESCAGTTVLFADGDA